jgi:hypothetical protein
MLSLCVPIFAAIKIVTFFCFILVNYLTFEGYTSFALLGWTLCLWVTIFFFFAYSCVYWWLSFCLGSLFLSSSKILFSDFLPVCLVAIGNFWPHKSRWEMFPFSLFSGRVHATYIFLQCLLLKWLSKITSEISWAYLLFVRKFLIA